MREFADAMVERHQDGNMEVRAARQREAFMCLIVRHLMQGAVCILSDRAEGQPLLGAWKKVGESEARTLAMSERS